MRRLLGLLATVAVLLVAGQGTASAHAILAESTPADGSTLSAAPRSLTLRFDEDVLIRSASVILRSDNGNVLAQTGSGPQDLHVSGPEDGTDLVVGLPPLSRGTFGVTWQVQSTDDLHRTSGTLVFGIGEPVRASASNRWGPPPPPSSAALRWLDLLTVALLLGAALSVLTVVPRARLDDPVRHRLNALLWRIASYAAAAGALVGVVVLAEVSDVAAGLRDVGAILSSTLFGRLWLLREAALITVGVLAARTARGRPGIRSSGGAGVAIVALVASLVSLAGASHVGLGGGRPIAVALLTVHLAAGAAWAGGMLMLCALPPILRHVGCPVSLRPLLRAFALPAAGCVALVVTTGIALTGRQVASLDALLTTAYGQILMAKVTLVGVAGALGLLAAFRLRRPGRPGRPGRGGASTTRSLRRRTWSEAAVLVGVLGSAAALSVGTAARGPAFAPTVRGAQSQLAAQVSDVFETLAFSPNEVGQSWLRVTVNQTRRPAPAPISGVSAVVVAPNGRALPARNLESSEVEHLWELRTVDLTSAGTWRVSVAVHRGGRPDVVWDADWTVRGGPSGGRQPAVSDHPWGWLLDWMAVGLAVLLCLLAAIHLRRQRHREEFEAHAVTDIESDQQSLARV